MASSEPVRKDELQSNHATVTKAPERRFTASSALTEQPVMQPSGASELPESRKHLPARESDGPDDPSIAALADQSVHDPPQRLDSHERTSAEASAAKPLALSEKTTEGPSVVADGLIADDPPIVLATPNKEFAQPKFGSAVARLWSAESGTQVSAYVVAILNDSVRLRRVDGNLEIDVPLDRLGDEDRSHVNRLRVIQTRNERAAGTMLRTAQRYVDKSPFRALNYIGRVVDLVPGTRWVDEAVLIEKEAIRKLPSRTDLSDLLSARFACYFETLSGSDAPRIERIAMELRANDEHPFQYIEVWHDSDSEGIVRDALDAWHAPVSKFRYAARLDDPIQVTSSSSLNGTIFDWRSAASTALYGLRFRFVTDNVMHELRPVLKFDMHGNAETQVKVALFADNHNSGSISGGLRADIASHVQATGRSDCKRKAKEAAAHLEQLLDNSLNRVDAIKTATKPCRQCRGSGRSGRYTTVEEGTASFGNRYGELYRMDKVRYHDCQTCSGVGAVLSDHRKATILRLKETIAPLQESQALWTSVASWKPYSSPDIESTNESCEASLIRVVGDFLKADPSPSQAAMVQEVLIRFRDNRDKLPAEQRVEIQSIIRRFRQDSKRVSPRRRASLEARMFRRIDGELRDELDTVFDRFEAMNN